MLIWSYLRREDFGNSIMILLKVEVMRVSNFLSVVYCIIICVTPPTTLAHFRIFFSSWILYYTQEYAQCQPKKKELGSVGIFYKKWRHYNLLWNGNDVLCVWQVRKWAPSSVLQTSCGGNKEATPSGTSGSLLNMFNSFTWTFHTLKIKEIKDEDSILIA